MGLLINKNIAGKIEEFYIIRERVAGLVIKLNKRYKLKLREAYAPSSCHDDQPVERFYEDVNPAMSKVKTQHSVLMWDRNAKVGREKPGNHTVGDYGIGSSNGRGKLLVEFNS